MSEEKEIETQIKEENVCLCKSKGFKNLVTVIVGSFIGGYCAISLFVGLHKPPMPPMGFNQPMPPMMHQNFKKPRHFNENIPPQFEGKAPIQFEGKVPPKDKKHKADKK